MKKIVAMFSMIFTMVLASALTAQAAPQTMPDGNIFDGEFYAAVYPDVAKALGTDVSVLYNHYLNYGKAEGRIPYNPENNVTINNGTTVGNTGNGFDAAYYAAKYPEVVAVLGNDAATLQSHYNNYGIKEGRFPNAMAEANAKGQQTVNTMANNNNATTVTNTNNTTALNGDALVWITQYGKKYHSFNNCGTTNSSQARQVTLNFAISHNIEKCTKCW